MFIFYRRVPKTRSMDNLVSACENVTLTRTSSDPNLNKHCQEGRSTLESSQPMSIQCAGLSGTPEDVPVTGLVNDDQELEISSSASHEDNVRAEPCLTTQPLPSMPHPLSLDQDSSLTVLLQISPLLQEVQAVRPAEVTSCMSTTQDPVCNGFAHTEENGPFINSESSTVYERLPPLPPLESSGETLEEENTIPPVSKALSAESQGRLAAKMAEAVRNGELIPVKDRAPVPTEYARAARRLISQSQLTDLSLLGSQWDSVQGLVQSACGGAIQNGSYHGRRLANKLLRAHGGSSNGGPCCRRDPLCTPGSPVQSGWFSSVKNTSYAALCSSAASSLAMGPSFRQLLPSHCSPSPGGSPGLYVDDDGLPVAVDAVQQRLRQIEASYKQEVEVLRRQVKQLQLKLESKQFCSPPSEPDVDYEDDIVSYICPCFPYFPLLGNVSGHACTCV